MTEPVETPPKATSRRLWLLAVGSLLAGVLVVVVVFKLTTPRYDSGSARDACAEYVQIQAGFLSRQATHHWTVASTGHLAWTTTGDVTLPDGTTHHFTCSTAVIDGQFEQVGPVALGK